MTQEKLVIYLHANDLEHPSWAVLDNENTVRQSAAHDNADGLAQIATEKEVIVIVPAEDVLLTSTKLPKMNRSRLAQALPYALEEQLIDDVDTMHFAAAEQIPDKDLSVVVVSLMKMQQWKALLQAWNIKPDVLTPGIFALPVTEHAWHVAITDLAIVRTNAWHGFACDRSNLAELIAAAVLSSYHPPQHLIVDNYTSHAFASVLAGSVNVNETFISAEKFITDAAKQICKTPQINLLQGDFAVKKSRLPQLNKVWKAATYLGIAWLALLFLYPTISYFILAHRYHGVTDQITEIYRRNFPQASNIVAPKQRMEEKLQKLNAQIGENKFLLLIGYVGKGMLETDSIKLKRFDYQNNTLNLELTAGSSEDLSAFTEFLSRQGLSVKQQNATLSGNRMNATLQVE